VSKMTLRPATLEDSELIFSWRNSELVRRQSFNPQIMHFENHQAWFEKSLQNKNRFILIAELHKEPLGVFRLDTLTNNEVSLFLNPSVIGKGYGESLLEAGITWIRENLPHISHLEAKVMPTNIASTKIFEKQGFIKKFISYEKVIDNKERLL